jgi:hypothetical protein
MAYLRGIIILLSDVSLSYGYDSGNTAESGNRIVPEYSSFLSQRKAHPPLGAGAEVYHGVEVVIAGNHVNRTAPSGWMVRLVRLFFLQVAAIYL